tara:strand:- start:1480 stop:2724 length:1245 start_codon:yes stop_codon:yes gene_type:complete
MTSVQDSINALYAEAERNAKDGTPMFALLHGMPTDDAPADPKLADPALADQALADGKPTADAHAEIPIPMQPDTSAMDIADASPRQMMETAPAHTDKAVAYAEPSRAARFEALRMLAEREVDAAPAQDDTVGRTVTHHSIDSESLRGATPVTHAAEGLPAALPEQPPAPPALETDKDLDITDIHQLVQQAWEDGDAGMISPVPEKQDQKSPGDDAPAFNGQNMHDQAGDKRTGTDTDHPQNQAAADIGIAMENIAAAVKDQQPPAAAPLDVDALKGEIVQAVKSEFRQALRDDLAPVVKNVVTEVMTEIARERAARERAAKERATKEMVARELAAKEQAASTPVVKSTSANAGARKATKSAAVKTAGTVQAKAAAKKTAKSSAAKSSAAKSTGTKTKAKAKTRAKKTRSDLDIG